MYLALRSLRAIVDEDLRVGFLIEIELAHVRHDADDLPRRASQRVDLFADRMVG
jgi:hypothetical protein